MNYRSFLFGFGGRINRAKYWLALVVSLASTIAALAPAAWLLQSGTGQSSFKFGNLFEISGLPIGTPQGWAFTIPLTVFLFWVFAATSVKRLHDRGRSAWWIAFFVAGPYLFGILGALLGDSYVALSLHLLGIALNIWFGIEMLFLRGTRGANRFGPDPLQKTRWA